MFYWEGVGASVRMLRSRLTILCQLLKLIHLYFFLPQLRHINLLVSAPTTSFTTPANHLLIWWMLSFKRYEPHLSTLGWCASRYLNLVYRGTRRIPAHRVPCLPCWKLVCMLLRPVTHYPVRSWRFGRQHSHSPSTPFVAISAIYRDHKAHSMERYPHDRPGFEHVPVPLIARKHALARCQR